LRSIAFFGVILDKVYVYDPLEKFCPPSMAGIHSKKGTLNCTLALNDVNSEKAVFGKRAKKES
jgi:hypothetical protein